jgi:phytoene desaturase
MKTRIILIGAGYGSLALANLLARAGHQVDVFERNTMPGGRTGLVTQDGFRFDTGPSWYLMPEVFEQYYKIFDRDAIKELDLIRLSPGYKVFFEGDDPVVINGDLSKDVDTFESLEAGAGAMLQQYVEMSEKIYNLSVKHFLYTNFEKPSELLHPDIIKNSLSMLRYAFSSIDDHVSRYFTDTRIKRLLEYHMVFLGSSPYQAPAIYSLMSVLDYKSGVFYPRKGMYSLIDSMVSIGQSLGVQSHYNAEVQSIDSEGNHATGITLSDGSQHKADIVVSGADLHFTETSLLPAEKQSFPEPYWERRQPGPSALLISLGIRGSLPQLLHHNLLFVEDWQENFKAIYEDYTIPKSASIYVCNPSKTDPSVAPPGHENIFILVPLPAKKSYTPSEQEALTTRFINQFAKMIDQPDLVSRIVTRYIFGPEDFRTVYHSWQAGALGGQSHLLSQSAIFRTQNKSKKLDNLYYVGAGTTPGIGLPMCLMSAQLVYKRIAGIKSGGPLTHIEPLERES